MKKQIGMDKISFIGTILGLILGITDIVYTILFTNLTFIVGYIVSKKALALSFVIILLVLSNLVLYKGIKKDLLQFNWIKRRCPRKIKSYNVYFTE